VSTVRDRSLRERRLDTYRGVRQVEAVRAHPMPMRLVERRVRACYRFDNGDTASMCKPPTA